MNAPETLAPLRTAKECAALVASPAVHLHARKLLALAERGIVPSIPWGRRKLFDVAAVSRALRVLKSPSQQ